MKLLAYLQKHKITQRKFAKDINMKPQAFNDRIHGKRNWKPAEALLVEAKTKGEVDRYDLMGQSALVLWPVSNRD